MYGRALVHVFQIKRRPHVGHVHLAGIQRRHAVPFGFRQPDVKVQIQRFADVFLPVTPQAFPGQPQHEFIKHHPVSMRMVAVFRRLPRRNGFLQGAHAILMVKYACRPGKSRQTALMGHHLRDGCIGQREFRPQFPHAHLRRGSLLVQGQQKGGGCGSLGGGVNGHQRMFRPWTRFIRCGKPGMQGNDFPSLLPDRNGSAQFSVVTEVFLKSFSYLPVLIHSLKMTRRYSRRPDRKILPSGSESKLRRCPGWSAPEQDNL